MASHATGSVRARVMEISDLDTKWILGIAAGAIGVGWAVVIGMVRFWKALNQTKDERRALAPADGMPTTASEVVIHWSRLIDGLERFQRTLTDRVDELQGAHEECLRDAATLRRQNDQQEMRIERLERQLTGPR